jgi:hypothetical protein
MSDTRDRATRNSVVTATAVAERPRVTTPSGCVRPRRAGSGQLLACSLTRIAHASCWCRGEMLTFAGNGVRRSRGTVAPQRSKPRCGHTGWQAAGHALIEHSPGDSRRRCSWSISVCVRRPRPSRGAPAFTAALHRAHARADRGTCPGSRGVPNRRDILRQAFGCKLGGSSPSGRRRSSPIFCRPHRCTERPTSTWSLVWRTRGPCSAGVGRTARSL